MSVVILIIIILILVNVRNESFSLPSLRLPSLRLPSFSLPSFKLPSFGLPSFGLNSKTPPPPSPLQLSIAGAFTADGVAGYEAEPMVKAATKAVTSSSGTIEQKAKAAAKAAGNAGAKNSTQIVVAVEVAKFLGASPNEISTIANSVAQIAYSTPPVIPKTITSMSQVPNYYPNYVTNVGSSYWMNDISPYGDCPYTKVPGSCIMSDLNQAFAMCSSKPDCRMVWGKPSWIDGSGKFYFQLSKNNMTQPADAPGTTVSYVKN
jgi:hypothetical protein